MFAPVIEEQLWRKSSYSGQGGNCLEVAVGSPQITPVRDSTDPGGPALLFPTPSWGAFVAGVRAGGFPTHS
ncbi:DUF397 domain-containing protein [Kitasatospora sp. LaBMicrA B282]|uniref:DUF397 domain-containing protein n=1 Tax=Kitasatospora sp. LaBMicrA B282 TaxID=3420949 RepID=UPI003D0F0650